MAEAFSKRQEKPTDRTSSHYKQAVARSIRNPPVGYVVNSHHIQCEYRFEEGQENVKKFYPLLDSLEQVFSKPLFCCGGSLQPPDIDKFTLKVKPTKDKEHWLEYKLADLPVEELLKYCSPAPFGDLRKMKTVLDSEVRLAYEIETERFKIDSSARGLEVVPEGICIEKHIEDTLTPGRYVNLDRYKVNVYSEGGFFKPHADSPSGDEMIGTLVLCLPSPHKGGELCVSHDGLEHVFDFSNHSGDKSKIQWAAFYSSCIHEVKPVLEGHRVTITYKITLPNDRHKQRGAEFISGYSVPVKEHFEVSTESLSVIAKNLANVNDELQKIRQQVSGSPSHIGILLKHKYISKGLQQRLLKGEDKVLYDFLIEKQWKCTLMSVLSRYQTAAVYPDSIEDAELEQSHEIYEFNQLPFSPFAVANEAPRNYWPMGFRRDHRKWRAGIPFIDIYRRDENGALVRNNEGHGQWLANDVEAVGVDKIYLESAVIVELCEKP